MEWKVPLADVVVADEDIAAVEEVLRSGWLSMGPRTAALEEAVASYTGAGHALAVANGTAALHLACLAAGIGPGDEVVVPSMTFVATVNAIAYTGAMPVFAEISGITEPWLAYDAVSAAIGPRTAAIMHMPYGGHPGQTVALAELASRRGLCLLEDAAHALGSRLANRHLGTFGAIGAYSLFANKNLVAGEGGIVVTDDDALARRMRTLRSHGMTTLTWDRHRGHASTYDVVELGYNYRIDEMRAALATSRLPRLDRENRARGEIVARMRAGLEGVDGLQAALPPAADAQLAHHLFTVVLDEGTDRAAVRDFMRSAGVQTSVHYPPVHRFSHHSRDLELPLTTAYGARTMTLPLFAHMTTDQTDLVLEALVDAVAHARAGVPGGRA
jgi:dTDP-4-amino-4,6-dideoxygalactose transaminase